MTRRAWLVAAAVALAAACAKRVTTPLPASEDYLFPAPAARELSAAEEKSLREAWADVLAGDPERALRRLQRLRRPGALRPSVAAATGYAQLRAGQPERATQAFEAALAASAEYVPALVGAGSAATRQGAVDRALDLYRRAAAAAPADAAIRKRLSALKLQLTDRHMAMAQVARDAGDREGAAREYRAALEAAPEVAGVRLALADVLLEQQQPAAAIDVLSADTTADRAVALKLASVLTAQGDLERAEAVYEALLARDPGDREARDGRTDVRERRVERGLPEEYGRIPAAERVSRADLAALLAVRVPALGRNGPGAARVAVDIGGSWAKDQIASVLSYGVMDVYPNHTFQPGATVRRVDLARVAARVLDRLGWPRAAASRPTDVPRSHLDADAVDRVLGAGLMALSEAGAFEPWRPVSGREAKEVVDSLARLGTR